MGDVIYLAGRDEPATVLLVEREPLMRSRTAAHLRKAGLSVMEAIDGTEVLKLLRSGRKVRVVLGDIDRHLSAILRGDFPQLILVIGIAGNASDVPQIEFETVRRPYDPGEVERAVKSRLAGLHPDN